VLEGVLRILAEVGPETTWAIVFSTAFIAVFVLYVGIALVATLRARDPQQQTIRYQVFRDLLELFRRRSSK
jgi:hypothetical protein